MSRKLLKRYRLARRVALILAAAPLFQLSQCQTGVSMVLQDSVNALPSTAFNIFQSLALLPIQVLLGGGSVGGGGFGGGGAGF